MIQSCAMAGRTDKIGSNAHGRNRLDSRVVAWMWLARLFRNYCKRQIYHDEMACLVADIMRLVALRWIVSRIRCILEAVNRRQERDLQGISSVAAALF